MTTSRSRIAILVASAAGLLGGCVAVPYDYGYYGYGYDHGHSYYGYPGYYYGPSLGFGFSYSDRHYYGRDRHWDRDHGDRRGDHWRDRDGRGGRDGRR